MSLSTLVVSSVATPGVSVAVDKIGTDYYPLTEILWGPYGTPVPVDTGTPLPTQFRNASGTAIGVSTAPIVVAPASAGPVWTVAQSGAFVVSVGQIVAVSLAANTSVLVQQGGSPWAVSLAGGNVGVSVVNLGTQVSLAGGTANIGNVGMAPNTTGGLDVHRVITSASTNAAVIKAAAGQVYGYAVYSTQATPRYLKLYNLTSISASAGNYTPKMTIVVPGASAGSGANIEFVNGVAFGTGICMAITASIADNDSTVVALNDVVANILYK